MNKISQSTRELIRVAGRLREVVTIKNAKGEIMHRFMSPVMIEFKPKDFIQVIVGSSLLAVPVSFTEEVWKLGESLPLSNVVSLAITSLLFIALFSYYNYYRQDGLKKHFWEFVKRVFFTYLLSLLVAAFLLSLLDKAPWTTEYMVAFKRCVLVAFPASMSAAVADMIK